MVFFRKCPCCGGKVGLWDILQPLFRRRVDARGIVCSRCGNLISRFFERNVYGAALIVFFAGGLFQKVFEVESALGYSLLLIFLLCVFFAAIYSLVPFENCDKGA